MGNRDIAEAMADERDPENQRADNDGSWKDLIEHMWPQFIQRTLPDLYRDIDLEKKPEFLTQELRDPLPEAEKRNSAQSVDELIRVFLKDGAGLWVYLHIEVQGPGGDYFPYRMFSYCCLIVSHYHEVPVALAVLTAPRPVAERGSLASYEAGSYGTRLSYQYNCLELYALDDEELLSSENPVDLAFYAAKKAAGCQDREHQKLRYLRELTRLLAAKGWSEEARREVFTFVARVINLKDPELRGQYLEELEAEKEATKMESFVEKYFLDKARSQGLEQGRSEGLEQGIERGRSQGFLVAIRNLMETMKWSASEAMAAMKIPQAEQARYAAML